MFRPENVPRQSVAVVTPNHPAGIAIYDALTRVLKFADALPRSPDVALDWCDALLAFTLETNPALADGDGDLDEHVLVHDFLIAKHRGGGRS